MIYFVYITLTIVIDMCISVPPLTTTEHPDTIHESYQEDLKGIKVSLRTLAEHIGKWNYVYISQFEPRIVSSAIVLSNIDTNVRNLQERAHVWDTFQLHIAAWNEQLSTSDRKLDIISKAQEEILEFQGKLNSYSTFEYKLDNIFKKLEQFEERLSDLNKKVETISQSRDSLFGEFATRGILSTLKLIERKLDKIYLAAQSNKPAQLNKYVEEPKGKLTIKCNTPPVLEELLHDVASKVDVIFDKVNLDNSNEDVEGSDYLDDQQYSNDDLQADTDIRLINQVWKRINRPWKHTNNLLEKLISNVEVINNSTLVILENEQIYFDSFKSCQVTELKLTASKLFRSLDGINYAINYTHMELENSLKVHFKEHLMHFDQNFKNNCRTHEQVTQAIQKKHIPTSYIERDEIWFCDDIAVGEKSGVYRLGNYSAINPLDSNYFIQYCDIRNDGSWTVIQNRNNYTELQNFNLDWYSYKTGFGDLNADFWFGNDFIHKLTQEQDMILRIELEDFEGNFAWAEYDNFKIASEYENYQLMVGNYNGNASDSFSSHNKSLFSTADVKNDEAPECCPCAGSYGGGWWFNSCFESNLNGIYYRHPYDKDMFRGIIWEHWLGDYSLKKTKMMLKKKETNHNTQEGKTTTAFSIFEDP